MIETDSHSGSVRYSIKVGELPIGLELSTETGAITGIPSEVTEKSVIITIEASNDVGGITTKLKMEVLPIVMKYPKRSLTLSQGELMKTVIPTITPNAEALTSYTVSPELPKGVMLARQTGKLLGTPAHGSEDTFYTITGSNDNGGKAIYNISIKVKPILVEVVEPEVEVPKKEPIMDEVPVVAALEQGIHIFMIILFCILSIIHNFLFHIVCSNHTRRGNHSSRITNIATI